MRSPWRCASTPVRVLVVSPRPEDERAGYLDHRVSALPLVEALATLGGRVELEILGTPTLAGLSEALATAERPYHVVHFDGHGIYNRERGLGALCFENPADADQLEGRSTDRVGWCAKISPCSGAKPWRIFRRRHRTALWDAAASY